MCTDGSRIHRLEGYGTLQDFIADYYPNGCVRALELSKKDGGIPLCDVSLEAPIPIPKRDVICIGQNYLAHALESHRAAGTEYKPLERPTYFIKRVSRAVKPGGEIPAHSGLTQKLDYEAELAVIIGKRCTKVAKEDVFPYIFGYTIANDVSARDIQRGYGGQWAFGKSLDGCAPMGPWIVTADELQSPPVLKITARVNGEGRQEGRTDDFIFDIPHIVSELSRGITLMPGDIIMTGTPSGVGMGFDPPKFLRPGDVVECEIEGIGVLRNVVGDSNA
ncbi:MAG: fumarylacetoacetate hydrolase family protein [Oscillospiraceae bacterium]|nr:fumarylacetoacetate hydrolase family protein [Oscillospiraceae bacterium]